MSNNKMRIVQKVFHCQKLKIEETLWNTTSSVKVWVMWKLLHLNINGTFAFQNLLFKIIYLLVKLFLLKDCLFVETNNNLEPPGKAGNFYTSRMAAWKHIYQKISNGTILSMLVSIVCKTASVHSTNWLNLQLFFKSSS